MNSVQNYATIDITYKYTQLKWDRNTQRREFNIFHFLFSAKCFVQFVTNLEILQENLMSLISNATSIAWNSTISLRKNVVFVQARDMKLLKNIFLISFLFYFLRVFRSYRDPYFIFCYFYKLQHTPQPIRVGFSEYIIPAL